AALRRNSLSLAILLAAGTLAAPTLADDVAPVDPPFEPVKIEMLPDEPATPGFDRAAYLATKKAALDAQVAFVAARSVKAIDGPLPNFYIFDGVPIPMDLDATRIGLFMRPGLTGAQALESARAAALQAGLATADAGHLIHGELVLLRLAAPLADAAAANKVIDTLAQSNDIDLASPVFIHAQLARGFFTPSPRILVRLKDAADTAAALGVHAPGAAVIERDLAGLERACLVRIAGKNGFAAMAQANALARDPRVEWAEPSARQSVEKHATTPNDPLFPFQWSHRNTGQSYQGSPPSLVGFDMDTDLAWDITLGVNTVLTAILDEGTQNNQSDLNWANGRDFTTGVTAGVGNGAPSTECENHGTAVAGCVSQRINNAAGGAGVAPATRVLGAKVFFNAASEEGCDGFADGYEPFWLANAINWARGQGARVTNASIGVGFSNAIQDAYTTTFNLGVVHFGSAGNGGFDGIGDNGSAFPASAQNVLSVSALGAYGSLTFFSNFGVGVDVAAPGLEVVTTDRTGALGYDPMNNTYFAGTSAASPMAAGVAALFFSQFPTATAAQARDAVIAGCRDLGEPGPDLFFSNGFVNAFNTLTVNAPPNDSCANAIALTGATASVGPLEVRWATSSRLEPSVVNASCLNATDLSNTVFYRYTVTNSGTLNVNTAGSTYDTVLFVYSGCTTLDENGNVAEQPTILACNDDSGAGVTSAVSGIQLTHGQSVIIKVARFGAEPGPGLLRLALTYTGAPSAPGNDGCTTATNIFDPGTGSFTFNPNPIDTNQATDSACEARESCGEPGGNSNSVYYRFVPIRDGTVELDTLGSQYDTVLSVFDTCANFIQGSCVQPPRRFGCNDDIAPSIPQSRISALAVSAGQQYLIKVADYGGEGGGILDFNFAYTPRTPSNDLCTAPAIIPAAEGTAAPITQDLFFATRSSCENPAPCAALGGGPFHTVWYAFTPATDGSVSVDTFGSEFDTVLALFSSCATFDPETDCIT
ncbi:MAG: S8 family peptidase, partial [Phycisphaerales bacterium]